jgi:hypothetical protein
VQVVPDLGQVPELDPEVVTRGLETVVAFLQGDRVERDQQGPLSGDPGDQPPAAVSAGWAVLAGGGEGKSWWWGAAGPAGRIVAAGRLGSGASCGAGVVGGFGPGAAVAGGVSLLVGDGHAPRRLRVGGGRAGQVPGQGRVIQSRSKYT